MVSQAKSIISAIRASVANGKIIADQETVETRLAICEGCPKLILKSYRGREWYTCKICGCAYKRKVAVSGSSCPLEKW